MRGHCAAARERWCAFFGILLFFSLFADNVANTVRERSEGGSWVKFDRMLEFCKIKISRKLQITKCKIKYKKL